MAQHNKIRSWDEKLFRPTNDCDDSTPFTRGARKWADIENKKEDQDYEASAHDNGYRRDPGNTNREQNGWYRTALPRVTPSRADTAK